MLEEWNATLEQDAVLRENVKQGVRELDATCRHATAMANAIHAEPLHVKEIAQRVQEYLHTDVREKLASLANIIPHGRFFQFNEMWTRSIQTACFLSALVYYFQRGDIMPPEFMHDLLGVEVDLKNEKNDFHVLLEDYLHGLISLINELARFAVNVVTRGDPNTVLEISQFLQNAFTGFQMLNFKNDALRRRFDSIKYDVKKVEQVVYDLSIRNLLAKTASNTS